MYLMFFVFNQ